MGYRLSKIVTRTGDQGTTGLGDGTRVPKDALRVAALGDVDELNSVIGCVLAGEVPEPIRSMLLTVQNDLFDLGGELSIPGRVAMTEGHAARLDAAIADLNAELPPLREFVLPGGTHAASTCQLARTVCRRAERTLVALERAETVSPETMRYLNRLSDLLFVTARTLNRLAGTAETSWNPRP